MRVPAVVAAGDRGAARAVLGQSKAFLELGGRPLVAHVVAVLQRVPEISEVWVVGDEPRLRAVLAREEVAREIRKPLHLVPQFATLYENAWQTFRRLLPDAGPEGRDPGPEELDTRVLYLSADLPFATPQEISQFVRRGAELDADYVLGLVSEESLAAFYPRGRSDRGIRMAYFNLREGRVRQSNLHLVRPARIGVREYIERMYESRHQRELRDVVRLAWRLLRSERGGLRVILYFLVMHLAGFLNRHGMRRLADLIRRFIPVARIERGCSDLLRTRFRFALTDVGGCAVDIDSDRDFEVARERFAEWRQAQNQRALAVGGELPLPPRAEP
jgi:hypothetical protein